MKTHIILFFFLFIFCVAFVYGGDTLRIATYNVLNYPGSDPATRNPYFRAVVHSMQPDVLVVQEMQSQVGVDGLSNNVLNYYTAGLYTSVPFNDGPDSDNALFYKSSKVTFISANYINTALRRIAEYVVKPTWSNEVLRIYSLHLKAGSTNDDESKRRAECTILRNYLNTQLPPGTNFIIVGDFNTYASSDSGLQVLLSSATDNDGRAKDPLNLVGTWNNNSSFKNYHTQSPRVRSFGGGTNGGMDDRFDLILTSYSSLNDNIVLSSYKAYGNDGNHLNDSINHLPNFAVPDSVANGLHYAADHIPVVCNFTFPETTQAITITMDIRNSGWNLISLPLVPYNSVSWEVFPYTQSYAYYYAGTSGYARDISMRSKVGYWMKFGVDTTVEFTGKQRGIDTVFVSNGWNLIGATDHDVAVEGLIIEPSGIIDSPFFDFKGSYVIADTIRKGGGYFVRVNGSGRIILE
ncbi:MAG: hypothetical protein EPO24_04930 [Bacteroidetes bacterium]|nr:MAG: hypothetical protein EPO24_04930 [Bacteroidota bacterium]